MTVIPKRPKMTEGMPESRFIICLIGGTSLLGQNLYSAIAVKSPMPIPITTDNAVT